jgi:hypothetical protein
MFERTAAAWPVISARISWNKAMVRSLSEADNAVPKTSWILGLFLGDRRRRRCAF